MAARLPGAQMCGDFDIPTHLCTRDSRYFAFSDGL